MHSNWLSILRCPIEGTPLQLEVKEQASDDDVLSETLVSSSGHRYPIRGGIPRFLGEGHYAESFAFEWTRWPRVQFESENVGRPMAGHTSAMWKSATGNPNVHGQVIAEYGCGPGRFLDVVRKEGGRAVGVELTAAVDVARRNLGTDPDLLLVQADILAPPFANGVFDGAYSIGVLHHTPDPSSRLEALARSVKSGGWVACCVYPKSGFYDWPSVERIRRLHNRIKPVLGYGPALLYCYLAAYLFTPLIGSARRLPYIGRYATGLSRNWLPTLPLPDLRWRALDIFDAITPSVATTHDGAEVTRWMQQGNCSDIRTTEWCDTSQIGIRD